jgi:hypothetical protein
LLSAEWLIVTADPQTVVECNLFCCRTAIIPVLHHILSHFTFHAILSRDFHRTRYFLPFSFAMRHLERCGKHGKMPHRRRVTWPSFVKLLPDIFTVRRDIVVHNLPLKTIGMPWYRTSSRPFAQHPVQSLICYKFHLVAVELYFLISVLCF